MKKIFNSNSLTILLLIVATSCIARSLRHHKTNMKYTDGDDFVDICPSHASGQLYTYVYDVPVNELDFNATMNISDNHACHWQHYRGNVSGYILPGGGSFGGTMDIDLYFCKEQFNFNATFCSGDCSNYAYNGSYIETQISSTCSRFWISFGQ